MPMLDGRMLDRRILCGPIGVVICLVLAFCARDARCGTPSDPTPPPAGFPQVLETHEFTYTDGYRVLLDARYPDPTLHAPGPDGWPILVLIHGLDGKRQGVSQSALAFASRGYMAISYDVRGQGDSYLLNDPALYGWTGFGIRERIDLAEVMEEVESIYQDISDFDRIGVSGGSQGAIHSFFAAADSGKTYPPEYGRVNPFPVISCAVPIAFTPDLEDVIFNRGKAAHRYILRPPSFTEPVLRSFLTANINSEDFDAIVNLLYDSRIDLCTRLQNSIVPLFATASYDDFWTPVTPLTNLWTSLTQPKRLMLSTGGHSSPGNQGLAFRFQADRFRWINHYIKGIQNGIDTEDPVYAAIVPRNPASYNSLEAVWNTRTLPSLDSSLRRTRSAFLRENGSIRLRPASGTEPADVLAQTNLTGLDMATYADNDLSPAELMQHIPLAPIVYESAALRRAYHFFGSPDVTLHVTSSQTTFQLHVAFFDVDEDGEARFFAGGSFTSRDDVPAGDNLIRVQMDFHSYLMREGHKLRIQIENLAWFRPPLEPQTSIIRRAPVFQDFTVLVQHDAVRPTAVEVSILRPE